MRILQVRVKYSFQRRKYSRKMSVLAKEFFPSVLNILSTSARQILISIQMLATIQHELNLSVFILQLFHQILRQEVQHPGRVPLSNLADFPLNKNGYFCTLLTWPLNKSGYFCTLLTWPPLSISFSHAHVVLFTRTSIGESEFQP